MTLQRERLEAASQSGPHSPSAVEAVLVVVGAPFLRLDGPVWFPKLLERIHGDFDARRELVSPFHPEDLQPQRELLWPHSESADHYGGRSGPQGIRRPQGRFPPPRLPEPT